MRFERMVNNMIYIREDLIKYELEIYKENYKQFNLHNSLISKLKNHYICESMYENFYDSEPEYDDDIFDKYMDYYDYLNGNYSLDIKDRYYKEECTIEELKQAYNTILQQRENYEQKRIEFCNWQEPYFNGVWEMSQKQVNNIAISTLKEIKRYPMSNKKRFYISEYDNRINIYWYGRDYKYVDYWFRFKRKEK